MAEMAKPVFAERTPAAGACPECGERNLQRYEVLSEGGWWVVVKCQSCLASVERTPWNRLGYVNRDHADVVINASRDRGR